MFGEAVRSLSNSRMELLDLYQFVVGYLLPFSYLMRHKFSIFRLFLADLIITPFPPAF
uniref:Uncharacterized protein n=1 Tax=Arundo donax TaxID=35708 RepID=A0A0A9HTF8_ARUDO